MSTSIIDIKTSGALDRHYEYLLWQEEIPDIYFIAGTFIQLHSEKTKMERNGARFNFAKRYLGRREERGGEMRGLVCMYVCMVITFSRVWIDRVRLTILLVVSSTGKMNISLSPFAPENLISRAGFGRRVLRRVSVLIIHTQTGSGAYSRNPSRFPRRRPFTYTAIRH